VLIEKTFDRLDAMLYNTVRRFETNKKTFFSTLSTAIHDPEYGKHGKESR